MTEKNSEFMLLVLLILFLVAGCSAGATPVPPAPERPEGQVPAAVEAGGTPQAGETLEPAPAQEPTEPIPPIVLRTSPEPGQEQPLAAPLEITFDQPMDRASVEKAFAIEPGASVDGSFDWVDDQTVRFSFQDGFERGQRYRVRVVESAQSAAGLSLRQPFELRFSAVGFLEVADVQPADGATEVLPDTVVTVLFNRPVVPLDAIESGGSMPDPLTLVPPVRGQGTWLNTSIYQFTPDTGLQPSTEYTARVAKGLTDALGSTMLEDDFEWTFTTLAPAVVASIPAAGDIFVSPTPVISLTFNQPMDRKSVEENLVLVDASGETVPGSFAWADKGIIQPPPSSEDPAYYEYGYAEGAGPEEVGVETVAFTPRVTLDFDTVYRVELPKGTLGRPGQTETQQDFSASFTVTPFPKIDSTFPEDGAEAAEPWGSLQITFNAPMNPKSVKIGENVIIEPTVSVTQVFTYWWNNNTNLEINFPGGASTRFEVRLGADIEGRYGQKIGAPTTVAWETRAESPFLFMNSPGRIATYNAYTNTLMFVTVRNVSQVNFGLYRLPSADFIRLNGNNWWEAWDNYRPDSDNSIAAWTLTTSPELDRNAIYRVDLGQESGLGDKLPPGLYYLEAFFNADSVYPPARTTGFVETRERQILVVSQNNITFKSSNSEALAWVTDLESGQPLQDIPVTVVAERETGPVETNGDGLAEVAYEVQRDPFEPRFAFAGDPDRPDENFAVAISNWADGIERYQFGNVNVEDYQLPFNAYFYTDRSIYRPGQTVHFKGIIRADDDANYSLPAASRAVSIIIADSQGKEIFKDELPLSQMGTINGSFELAENAALGFYSIQAIYDQDNFFYDDFQVAAYRKPEFLVEVTTDKPEYAQGESIKVSASARFFFGGPVSNAQVRWTLLSDDFIFRYQGPGFYDFVDYDYSRAGINNFVTGFGERIAEGEGTTDAEGRFTFEVEADIADKIASQRYTFDMVITDINNQEVAGQAEAVVHKGLVYLGLRPERYVGQVGQESSVNVLVVDWDSQPVANQEVQVVFAEHNWYSVQRQYEDGSFYWESVVDSVPVFTTSVKSDRNGQAAADFVPAQGGIFKVTATATDRVGNEVRSSTFTWISGREYVNWRQENNDRIDLIADQREYNVGDVATILVPHPYSGTVQALVTLERGHIYDHFVAELKTNSEQLKIPISEDLVPNMYVSVVVVKGTDEANPLPSFKVGYANLPINTASKELQITLRPNKPLEETYQPGETVEYFVNVVNSAGAPVEAELSLALVDKAVLSLAPEPPGQMLATFWRNRGLGVQTGAGLTLAIDRINLAIAPEAKGGGGGFDEGFGVIRGDFRDTALWLPDFVTDENGDGVVETSLPDNLTTWTLTGKGITGADTRVGEASVDIVSTKPLLVRPIAPRFFVVGDEARMGMIVQNNTDQSLEIETRFEAEGLTIEPVAETGLAVKPGERVKVEYDVTVTDVEVAKLTMGAKAVDGSQGDVLTFELPVYQFSTPETVATVGILEEDGTRIEGIALPRSFDPSQGDLTVSIDPSLAAGMRDGLTYLEHFPYECTEQTVSRFLPNVFTFRAYNHLNLENPELEARLPALVSVGLQRLYSQQHFDGGWGWWIRDDSNPIVTAYVLLGLVEAQRAGFSVDQNVIVAAVDFLKASLIAPGDVAEPWQANRQAFTLYALAEAGSGDLGRSVTLFNKRQQMDFFGRAYLAMALHILDPQAKQIRTLLSDITSGAVVSASGAHWEEAQVDYFAMNTDTRSTAIIIAALARIEPDNPLLPNAVRWLMSVRENGGHWETTQETAWAIIGLTDWMVTTGELEGRYAWQVSLNGVELGQGTVNETNLAETTKLRVEVEDLLADMVNRLAVERDPLDSAVTGSPGNLYYAAYLTYYKPVQEVKALDRGIIVSRQYALADDEAGRPISRATVGDIIDVKLTLIAPNDLHYVVVEDPFPAGAEGIDTSLATTSVVGQAPELTRTDRPNPWGGGYGWWYFSHAELRDEQAVLFATFLPKGTYEYSYQIRASLPGEFRVIPTQARQMYFPEVFGRSDGGLFRIGE